MFRKVCGILIFMLPLSAIAADQNEEETKALSGMSIVGNNDAPKSLYIVPWKSSEIGMETSLTSSLLNEGMTPIDKDVFMRELDFYEISTSN